MSRGETPAVRDVRCPSCGEMQLFLIDGRLTCANTVCLHPDYATTVGYAEWWAREDELSRAGDYLTDNGADDWLSYSYARQKEIDQLRPQGRGDEQGTDGTADAVEPADTEPHL